ncbi:hypothetical protein POM88_031010 [Heracleum sosnowskyi]|uniref:Uncharacterized protein n=1 Tax=Heracleum sosnowskyi TaxID=360622 RepID=A0AAD8HYI3_9APIA|nr:hypothetical protein POM88_031010 [Heracleum sosnowskyi]
MLVTLLHLSPSLCLQTVNFSLKFTFDDAHPNRGYWGGVKPDGVGLENYDSALAYPVQSPGVLGNQPDIVMDSLSVQGLGLAHPKKIFTFFSELHSYLASCGVDGVKVDVQTIIETLGAGFGGRVSLTHSYIRALEASIAENFPDNECISCMSHNTDGLYSARKLAVGRASNDFYPRDPASHTIHISLVAYNTLFLGKFMQPDWDMFHSLHPAADYHAAARSVGGCPIYVSDKPGNHNFDILRKLVLPDGSVLRDHCLADRHVIAFSPIQLEMEKVASPYWNGKAVIYTHRSGVRTQLPKGSSIPVTLKVLEYELFHFCPFQEIASNISFAAIGLLDMFNTSGAVEEFEVNLATEMKSELRNDALLSEEKSTTAVIELRVRECGRFGAYSSQPPLKCTVGNVDTEFTYEAATGLVTLTIPVPEQEMYRWHIEISI